MVQAFEGQDLYGGADWRNSGFRLFVKAVSFLKLVKWKWEISVEGYPSVVSLDKWGWGKWVLELEGYTKNHHKLVMLFNRNLDGNKTEANG